MAKYGKIVFLLLATLLYNSDNAIASNPTFELSLVNRIYTSSNEGSFDVMIRQTNPDQTEFLYAGGQYIIILDTTFQNDHLNYIYTKDTATYGTNRIPLQYVGALTKINNVLKINFGEQIAKGNEPVISGDSSTLVARIRFYNPDLYSESCLLGDQFYWKKNIPGEYTEIYFQRNGNIQQINNDQSIFSTEGLCEGFLCCLEVPLPPPRRLSPENYSTDLQYPVSLNWEKGFPVNYSAHLQIAVDSLFSNVIYEESVTSPDGPGNISVVLDSVKTPGKYYWRVRQGGIPPQGAYNEPWNFTISPNSILLNLTAIPEGLYLYDNFEFELKVYLRNVYAPFELVDSCSLTSSDSTFQNLLKFRNAQSGKYYIVVKTPNTIETWSKSGGYFLSRESGKNEFDFSTADSQAYCGNETEVRNKFCMYSGDVNQDGNIDLNDMLVIYFNSIYFAEGNYQSDLSGERFTDLSDILIAYNNAINFVSACLPITIPASVPDLSVYLYK